MMFNNRGNNQNGNRVSINTSSMRSYSDASLLTVRWWNNQLSINLAPAIGKDANGLTQYESEMSRVVQTSITPKNARALMVGINDEILPAIKNGTAASIAVPVGSENTRKILGLEYDGKNSYLVIYTNLGMDNTAGAQCKHLFAQSSFIKGYDPETGTYNGEETVESEFMEFISRIDHVSMLDGSIPHSTKYEAAMHTAGNNAGQNQGGGFNNNPQLPFASNSGGMPQTQYQAPTSNFMGSEMPFMPMN